jgi:arginine-tRNA-protein transferase
MSALTIFSGFNPQPDSALRYRVFLEYQTSVHKDPPSRWKMVDYTRFLCSGISRKTVTEGSGEKRLGSFHQVYRLDGKIIAVGVLDLLPNGVSSVYL